MQEIETNDTDYIQAIKDLKENTVSKDAYYKLKQENKRLISNLVEGNIETAPKKEEVDVGALRKALFDRETRRTGLEHVTKSLQLRQANLDAGLPDDYAGGSTDRLDLEKAQQVADGLQYCVDMANGDPDVFHNELLRVLNDTPIQNRRK